MIKFIKNLFKAKPKNPVFNIHHPDIAPNIEFAFEAAGRKFYRFVKDYQMPTGRYKYAEAFLYESELRMNLKTLNSYMDEIEKNIDGSKGVINISKVIQVIWAIRGRCKLAFSPETIERLATAIYFDESEDLSSLNIEYAEEKIKFFRKHKVITFFLTKPMSDLLGLSGFTETHFQTFLNQVEQAEQLIKDLMFDPEKPSLPNT
jgi:hypothetical protein